MINEYYAEYFTVSVKCKTPYKNEYNIYVDKSLIILPKNYSDTGKPTPLIISCHGAGGCVTANDSQIENIDFVKYFLANGYAVMDTNGLPEEYSQKHGIHIFNNIGAPFAVDAYVEAYNYCINKYNLRKEVFVMGASMGGISSTNLVLSGRIPVVAHAALCPVLDTYNEIFLNPWSDGLPKIALTKIYSLDIDKSGEPIYDENKINGFNPVKNPKANKYPVPVLFVQSINDSIVSAKITKEFIENCKSHGSNAEFFELPDGDHSPEYYGEPIETPSGINEYAGSKIDIHIGVEKIYKFI